MNETINNPTNTKERKIGRVGATGAAIALAAGGLAIAIPEGNTTPVPHDRIARTEPGSQNNVSSQEIVPGTTFDMVKGTLLVKKPNLRRAVANNPTPKHSSTTEHGAEPTYTPEVHHPKNVQHHPRINLGNDVVVHTPPITESPAPTPETPAPTPIVVN